MSVVNETVLTYLPPKRKTTPSGWLSFNAPCCHHNGTSSDTRLRGGLILNPDGVSYHCFNCGYKASWQQGRNLSIKMRKLLQWMNTPDDVINKLALTVMQENEGLEVKLRMTEMPEFNTVPMPEDAIKISDITDVNKHSMAILEYMSQRKLFLEDYTYYWSPSLGYRDRLIIPFYFEGRIVGWTARTIKDNSKYKYMSEQQPGYVFNLDNQGYRKIFVIVCEGPIDAIHIEGVALLGSEAKDQQRMLINRLSKDVIVVPDRDYAGSKLVEQAIDFGWGVSMPQWDNDINDIGDAVERYGRIFTLHSIVSHAQTSPLKIRLGAKKWFT
jgi:hypothetical protein|tara:strand:- start:2957 stop:3937 length:981 start_codon:yes stop_codon:yes gene_type:complete